MFLNIVPTLISYGSREDVFVFEKSITDMQYILDY